MGSRPTISPDTAKEIKQDLWDGKDQLSVALKHNVSQASVSRIQRGDQHSKVSWPDGSFGPMPPERERQLYIDRYPGVAVKGIIHQAMSGRGLSVEDIARRMQAREEEEEDREVESIKERKGKPEMTPDEHDEPIKPVGPKAWEGFKKTYPRWLWKDAPPELARRTAIYRATTADGADLLTAKQLKEQIELMYARILKQQRKETHRKKPHQKA